MARVLALPAAILPTSVLEEVAVDMVIRRARRLPADHALRLMFNVDTRLYDEQGHQAVRYGQGVHTKHRHLRYHDFFVARIRPEDRVLDVGCGIGAVAHDVAERSGATLVAIDLDARNIARARQEHAHPRVTYVVGDILRGLPGDTFDVVIISNVLEHLVERAATLRRVAQVAGAKRILIRVPLFERDWRVPLKQELGIEWRLDADHQTEYSVEQFRAEVTEAGLAVKHLEVRWGEIWAEAVH
jgi:SAM-dependent methyltransferase